MIMVTYAVGNLLPPSSAGPFAFVSEAVLVHVDDALAALFGQSCHGLCSISELIQSSRAVTIYDDIDIVQELLELLASGLSLQVKVCGMLAHVAVNLEERHIRKARASNLQDVGTVLGENTGNSWACDDTAHLQHLDALKDLLIVARSFWEWSWGKVAWQTADLPCRLLDIEFPLYDH
jgi:hypothetical protein